MGQKANFLTLKKSFINLNLQTHTPKQFLIGYLLNIGLKKLLLKKHILVTNSNINFVGNLIYIDLVLFFKTGKLLTYKKKKLKKTVAEYSKINTASLFAKHIFKKLNLFNTNILIFSSKILNKELKLKKQKVLLNFFYLKCRHFLKLLFQRRFMLFFDFLKKTVFLITGSIDANCFLQSLCLLFKYLHKKNHTRFFGFITLLINLILNSNWAGNLKIKGIKFLIKGRLRGKMRASSKFLQEGKVPRQSFNANVSYARQGVCTLYGVYGLTLWIYKN